jgi:hypothetical protein
MRRDLGLKNFICALVNLMDAINVEPNMLQALLLGCLVYLFILLLLLLFLVICFH